MRRFFPAAVLAVLMVAVATPAQAGYLIIRLILEGTGGGAGDGGGSAGGAELGGSGFYAGMEGMAGNPMGGSGGFRPPTGGGRPGGSQGSLSGPPGPMGGAGGGAASAAVPATHDPTRSIVVVIPVTEPLDKGSPFYNYPSGIHATSNPSWSPKIHMTHRGEKFVTNVFFDSVTIQVYSALNETPKFGRTHALDLQQAHYAWAHPKTSTRPNPKAGYDIMVLALAFGMVDEAMTVADELLALPEAKKDGVPGEVVGFVKAYGAMQAALKGAATKEGKAEYWQRKFRAPNLTPSPHYALISWDATEDEVRRRIGFLEENFKAFFLLHAIRGTEVPVPEAPLVVVMPKQGSDVLPLARALDAPGRLPADGFYTPEHDLLVLSPERLDPLGRTFNAEVQQVYRGVSRSDLLAGKGPKIDVNGQNNFKKPDEVARMQTLALVERFVEENATACTISREGSIQLLYATGQMPRYVSLPLWLSHGSANFFTRPKDATFVQGSDKKWSVTVSPANGFGVPNYVLQRQFADLYGHLMEEKLDRKELSAQRATLLRNVISDAYFLGLRDANDVNDPDPVKIDRSGIAMNSGKSPTPGTGIAGGAGAFGGAGGFTPGGAGIGRPPMGGFSGGSAAGPPTAGPGGAGLGPMGGAGPGLQTVAAEAEDDPIVIARKKREKLALKAQATSWALYYYLAKARPGELKNFLAELSTLPRDLPLDSPTITATFCRAFGIDQNPEAFARFADGWMEYTRTVAKAGIDIPLVEPKAPASGGTTGGAPGAPGGAPGPMGGGPGGPRK